MKESGQAAVELAMIVAAISLPLAVALFFLGDDVWLGIASVVAELLSQVPPIG